MNDKNSDEDWFTSSASSNITDSGKESRIENIAGLVRSHKVLSYVAGIGQIMLSLAVISIAALGLIKPFWISGFMTMMASLTFLIGLYFLYTTYAKKNSVQLIREAMRRVMKFKN